MPETTQQPESTDAQTRRCPFCDEEIRVLALKCKHCGEMLDETPRHQPNQDLAGQIGSSFSEASSSIQRHYRSTDTTWNPGIAAVLSFFIPGAGQIYKGEVGRGLLIFGGWIIGWLLVVPALIVWLWSVFDAATRIPPYQRQSP